MHYTLYLGMMYYDAIRHSLVDIETGAVIPVSDDDNIPDEFKAEIQMSKDHELALSLSQQFEHSNDTVVKSSPLMESLSRHRTDYSNIPINGESKMHQELLELNMDDPNAALPEVPEGEHGWLEDLTLARALQSMEFEMAGQTFEARMRREDFQGKEMRASSCKRQLLTVSSLICLIQVSLGVLHRLLIVILSWTHGLCLVISHSLLNMYL